MSRSSQKTHVGQPCIPYGIENGVGDQFSKAYFVGNCKNYADKFCIQNLLFHAIPSKSFSILNPTLWRMEGWKTWIFCANLKHFMQFLAKLIFWYIDLHPMMGWGLVNISFLCRFCHFMQFLGQKCFNELIP